MTLLILGLGLWVMGHLWNRFLPDVYARLGKAAYGVSVVIIVASVLAMIYGYRSAEFIHVWSPPAFFVHINNLLMVFAIFTFLGTIAAPGKAFLIGKVKNPQLTGFKIWALAHLLVNGDLAAIILFGGLMAWAVIEVILIKRQGEKHDRTMAKLGAIGHLLISAVVFCVIVMIHMWVGVSPFGG